MTAAAWAALLVCVALGINVGANNSAAELGPAYGAGIRTAGEAVGIIAVFSVAGAWLAGAPVVETMGRGLGGPAIFNTGGTSAIIVLFSALVAVVAANIIRIPVATSHALVGAIVGCGAFYGTVVWGAFGAILLWWLITPCVSLLASFAVARWVYPKLSQRLTTVPSIERVYRIALTGSGCYMAFSGGSNSLAKAVGPVIASGLMNPQSAALLGGFSMAVGALLFGRRMLDVVGRQITPLDGLAALFIEVICGTIILVASLRGVPVSLAEIVTCAVIGFGAAREGRHLASNPRIRTIYRFWPVCPLATGALSLALCALQHHFE